jgi:GT2 family glycosyltransferase
VNGQLRLRAVVLNYGRADLTLRCVESLARQHFEGSLDIVVVDNGSPGDDALSLRARLDRGVSLVTSPRNIGYAAGNNLGIRWSGVPRPDIVLVINNDVELVDEKTCAKLASALTACPGRAAVSPLVDDRDCPVSPHETTQVQRLPDFATVLVMSSFLLRILPAFRPRMKRLAYAEMLPLPPGAILETETVNGACFMARQDFLEEIGGLDEGTFLFFEEIVLGAQMKRLGYRGALATTTTIRHEQGAATETGGSRFRPAMGLEMYRSLRHYCRSYLGTRAPGRFVLAVLWLFEIPFRWARSFLSRRRGRAKS